MKMKMFSCFIYFYVHSNSPRALATSSGIQVVLENALNLVLLPSFMGVKRVRILDGAPTDIGDRSSLSGKQSLYFANVTSGADYTSTNGASSAALFLPVRQQPRPHYQCNVTK